MNMYVLMFVALELELKVFVASICDEAVGLGFGFWGAQTIPTSFSYSVLLGSYYG